MSDQYNGYIEVLSNLKEKWPHLDPERIVEGRKGFIEQQHIRHADQRTSKGDTLFLAA
jgi:hypothetical protein